jgi:hypothetical protein
VRFCTILLESSPRATFIVHNISNHDSLPLVGCPCHSICCSEAHAAHILYPSIKIPELVGKA